MISPSWLSFDHLNDQFEGTPTECGSYTVDIQAEQLVDNDLQTWNVATWTINVSQAVAFQSSAPTMTIAQGSEFSYTPLVTPNGSTLSMTSGPTWLSLHDGVLSGIPQTSGTYSVTLTASYDHDSYSKDTQTFWISVVPSCDLTTYTSLPLSSFNASQSRSIPEMWSFGSTSSSTTSYLWSFGDGSTSTVESPIHMYNNSGVYIVTLRATNNVGSKIATYIVHIYDSAPATTGYVGDLYTYTPDISKATTVTGANWLSWNSTYDRLQGMPSVAYDYNVTMYVNGTAYCNWMINVNATSSTSPAAAFGWSVSGLTATFDDRSILANDWEWNFGDGNSSTEENPSHTYASSGNYTVVLTVQNSEGFDTYSANVIIASSSSSNGLDDNGQNGINGPDSTNATELVADAMGVIGIIILIFGAITRHLLILILGLALIVLAFLIHLGVVII